MVSFFREKYLFPLFCFFLRSFFVPRLMAFSGGGEIQKSALVSDVKAGHEAVAVGLDNDDDGDVMFCFVRKLENGDLFLFFPTHIPLYYILDIFLQHISDYTIHVHTISTIWQHICRSLYYQMTKR